MDELRTQVTELKVDVALAKAGVAAMKEDMDGLRTEIAGLTRALHEMTMLVQSVKGGWKMAGMIVTGIASVAGFLAGAWAFINWVVQHVPGAK